MVFSTIIDKLKEDILTMGIFCFILTFLMLLNILLGSIESWAWGQWSTKKFWQGIFRSILINLCMIVFMIIVEIIPLALERVGMKIPQDLVTFVQLVALIFVSVKKYVKDIYEKFTRLLNASDEEITKALDDGRGEYNYEVSAKTDKNRDAQ